MNVEFGRNNTDAKTLQLVVKVVKLLSLNNMLRHSPYTT